MNHIDLSVVKDILTEIVREVNEIDEESFDDKAGRNNTEIAQLSKRLNRIADLCELAAAHVRQEYWSGKGFTDPTAE